MDAADRVRGHFDEARAVQARSADTLADGITRAAQALARALAQGGKVLACGNGGSAGDAQHLSSELVNRFERERRGLAAVALTTDSSTITSIANDYDYAEIFARQVRALGRDGDLLVAISTSGRSPNITRAVAAAHDTGMRVVALTGRDGGEVAAALGPDDFELRVPADSTARIQETHIIVIHCLCDLIDRQLLENDAT